jgi:hypothetical protein
MAGAGERIAKRARAVMAKEGLTLTLTKKVAGTYDPSSTSIAVQAENHTAYGTVEGMNPDGAGSTTQSEGVRRGKRKLTVAAYGLPEPLPGDTIGPIEGRSWTITGQTPVVMGGTPILYILAVQA